MSLCPTINISPYNIIGDKDNISLKMEPRLVEDIKEMYGIDLENRKLLAYLKRFGSIKIASSAARSLLNNCQTEDELAREDEEELKEAKAKLVLEENAELKTNSAALSEELLETKKLNFTLARRTSAEQKSAEDILNEMF